MISKKRAKREAKQLLRACLLDGVLDENRVRKVVEDVLAAGHRDRLAILAHLLRLVRYDRQQHAARIESAVPLPAELQEALEASMTRRHGPGLRAVFVVTPSLMGGMRVQVGSDVYDGSVRAGLAALEKRF